MDLSNPTAVREFLALCLDTRHGIRRTPAELAELMPGPLRDATEKYAPHLAELREAAETLEGHAAAARRVHADALAAWIRGEPQPVPDRAPATPDEERRERYAEALYATMEVTPQRHPWVTLSPFRRAVWYARADAAIRIADTETSATPPAPAADSDECPQNRIGNFIYLTDPVQLGPHFYEDDGSGGLRCVYCDVPVLWGGESLVESTVPTYVHNANSVNRTTAKHLVDPQDPTTTLCPGRIAASKPMPTEEAARLPLCGECRRAVTGKSGDED